MTSDANTSPIRAIETQAGDESTTTTLPNGRTVEVYESNDEVYAQLYELDTTPIGDPIRVIGASDPNLGSATDPIVASLGDQNFVVLATASGYTSSGSWGSSILAKVYDSNGNRQTIDSENSSVGNALVLARSSAGNADQRDPTVDVDANAIVTVSWRNNSLDRLEQRSFNLSEHV